MYGLLMISIGVASLSGIALRLVPLGKREDLFSFNFLSSVVWVVLLSAILLFSGSCGEPFTAAEILFGILYGAVQGIFLLSKSAAFSRGPISVTTLVGNCSVLLSTFVSVVFFGDPISIFDILGIVMLLAGVTLTVIGNGGVNGSFKSGWIFFSVLFFLFAGGVGIVFKCFGQVKEADVTHMMLISTIVMLLLLTFLSLPAHAFKVNGIFKVKKYVLLALGFGLGSCLYNRFNIQLSATLPGTLFFPVFNGGVIILSTVLGSVLLREKLKPLQWCGLMLGLAGIILVGVF